MKVLDRKSTVAALVRVGLTLSEVGLACAQQSATVNIVLTQVWTDTGLQVTSGETITVTASGTLNWLPGCSVLGGCTTTPNGDPWSTCQTFSPPFPAPGLACWSVIGKIGQNGTPFQVGTSLTNFPAPASGELFLGVNDNYPPDNIGSWIAKVMVSATDVYKINYFSNNAAPAPDATLRIDNPGLTYGTLCAMIYVFAADQQLTECCGCSETHNGLRTLSVRSNLTSNPLTGIVPTNGVIKIVSTAFNGVCDPTSSFSPTANVRAWVTHVGNPAGSAYPITETESSDSTLGATELSSLQAQCSFIHELGSGHGVCTCGSGD